MDYNRGTHPLGNPHTVNIWKILTYFLDERPQDAFDNDEEAFYSHEGCDQEDFVNDMDNLRGGANGEESVCVEEDVKVLDPDSTPLEEEILYNQDDGFSKADPLGALIEVGNGEGNPLSRVYSRHGSPALVRTFFHPDFELAYEEDVGHQMESGFVANYIQDAEVVFLLFCSMHLFLRFVGCGLEA